MGIESATAGDFLARAMREDMAARQSITQEARMAHQELARLCRERAGELRRGNRGFGAVHG